MQLIPPTLLWRCGEIVGKTCKKEDILYCIDTLKEDISVHILCHVDPYQLRQIELEIRNRKDLLQLTNLAWQHHHHNTYYTTTTTKNSLDSEKGESRNKFWEKEFRICLSDVNKGERFIMDQLHLFQDVVHTLKFRGNELNSNNVSAILQLPRLFRIDIHHPPRKQDNWGEILHLLTHHSSLREIAFYYGIIKEPDIDFLFDAIDNRLLHKKRNLVALHFVCVNLHHNTIIKLRERLYQNVHFTELAIDGCLNGDPLIGTFCKVNGIQKVNLSHNLLKDDVVQHLVPGNAQISEWSLQHLDVSHNKITVFGVNLLSYALDAGWKLLYLDLSHNFIEDQGAFFLANSLKQNSSLIWLSIESCNITSVGIRTLESPLSKHPTLKTLKVGGNLMDEAAHDFLFSLLGQNQVLEELHANWIGLREDGCSDALQNALAQNSTLKKLALGANRLRLKGAKMLSQAILQRCDQFCLEELDIHGNLLCMDSLVCLTEAILNSTKEKKEYYSKSQRKPLLQLKKLDISSNRFHNEIETKRYLQLLREHLDCVKCGKALEHTVYDDEL